jgi:glycosyltransferase involved in cell wall biosynthesis
MKPGISTFRSSHLAAVPTSANNTPAHRAVSHRRRTRVDLVLPVHNESATIAGVLESFHQAAEVDGLNLHFVVSEDGSRDGTADVVREMAAHLPITLISTPHRKGYSQAVVDGLRAAKASVVVCCDSDGQYDAADLSALVDRLHGHDAVWGYRNPRHDALARAVMSRSFRFAWSHIHHQVFVDPSCPFVCFTRDAVARVLGDGARVPLMPEGLWWEMSARVAGIGLDVVQQPVHHLSRPGGGTQVYKPQRIPRIASDNLAGLWLVRSDIEYQRSRRELGAAAEATVREAALASQ